jgi:hypothetical protein
VLDWVKADGHRTGNNPVDEISKPLPRQSELKGHHAASACIEVPAFIQQLYGDGEPSIVELTLAANQTVELVGDAIIKLDPNSSVRVIGDLKVMFPIYFRKAGSAQHGATASRRGADETPVVTVQNLCAGLTKKQNNVEKTRNQNVHGERGGLEPSTPCLLVTPSGARICSIRIRWRARRLSAGP